MGSRVVAIVVPLTVVVIGGGFGVWLVSRQAGQIAQLQQQSALDQQRLADLDAQRAQLQRRVETFTQERQAAEERLAALRTQLSTTTTELDRARGEMSALRTQYDALKEEHARQAADLSGLTNERDLARRQARQWQADHDEQERALARLRERFAWLDRDYRRLNDRINALGIATDPLPTASPETQTPASQNVSTASPPSPAIADPAIAPRPSAVGGQVVEQRTGGQDVAPIGGNVLVPQALPVGLHVPSGGALSVHQTVELPPIVVRRDAGGQAEAIRATVAEINGPYQFVLLDRGSRDGVTLGMTFDVLRVGRLVGSLTVVRVRPALSACDLIGATSVGELQVGDAVVQRAEPAPS